MVGQGSATGTGNGKETEGLFTSVLCVSALGTYVEMRELQKGVGGPGGHWRQLTLGYGITSVSEGPVEC